MNRAPSPRVLLGQGCLWPPGSSPRGPGLAFIVDQQALGAAPDVTRLPGLRLPFSLGAPSAPEASPRAHAEGVEEPPLDGPDVVDGPSRFLGPAQRWSVVHQGLLREASDVLRRLGDEVAEVDKRVGAEDLRLSEEWRKLKTIVNLSRRQHEAVLEKAEASLAAAYEARDRALEEARDADRRRVAAEDRERKLEALNAALERQVRARMAALATSTAGDGPAGIFAQEEALALEAMELGMERERLETMERQVAEAEVELDGREAKAALEIRVL